MKSNRSPDFNWPMRLHSLFLKLTGSLHKRIFCSCIQTWISWCRCSSFGGKCVTVECEWSKMEHMSLNQGIIIHISCIKACLSSCIVFTYYHSPLFVYQKHTEPYGNMRNYYTEVYGTAIRNHMEIFSTNFSYTESYGKKYTEMSNLPYGIPY